MATNSYRNQGPGYPYNKQAIFSPLEISEDESGR
jgi:hypothetical protein